MKKITLLLSVIFVIAFCQSALAQFSCDTAIALTDGFTAAGITTPGNGGVEDWNDPNPAGCTSNAFYWDDDVYLYQYTAGTDDEEISMTIFTRNGWNGIGVFSDCTGIALSGCLASANSVGGNVSQTVLANVGSGQTVYIAIGQWGAPNDLDFDVTAFNAVALVDPPSCTTVTAPADGAVDVLETAAITWNQAAGGATGYNISIGTSSGGTDVLDNLDVGNVLSYLPSPELDYSTEYFVTITPYNSNGDATGCPESSFTLRDAPPQGSTCADPIEVTLPLPYVTDDDTSNYGDDYAGGPGTDCGSTSGYLGGDDVVYAYTPTEDTSVTVTMTPGGTWSGLFIYTDCADIGVACTDGVANSSTDIREIILPVTAGTTYYIVISSWPSPQSIPYNLTISENTCTDPVATYAVVGDCTNGQQFFIDVDITDLGSATSLIISDDQGSAPQTTSATGVFTFGPYANTVPVNITVANDGDANCIISSGSLTQEFCQDFIVDCAVGPENLMYCYEDDGNIDPVIFTFTSSDGTPLNLNINAGNVEWNAFGNAPYDPLIVLDTDGVTELYNGGGNVGDLAGLSFQSTGDTISFYIASDFTINCQSSTTINPLDVTVSCATCINPTATYQIVDDCDNGDQFLIDVNVADLGDATSLTISNNIDASTVAVPSTGTYQAGPFGFGVDVVITISNDQDSNCVINSPAYQLLACPPANDNPCNATIASVNEDGSCDLINSGTLLEATDSGVAGGTCGGNPDDDVWFEFTALSEFQIISVLNVQTDDFFPNMDHAVYEGTCDNPIELYCSDADASITPALTVGNTYYVRLFSAGSDATDYTFDLCIRPGSGNVSVDQTTYTVEELVTDILIDSPCAQIENITFSTGTNFGEQNGIGYFSALDGGFPFEEGLLLTSGDASQAAGPNINFVSDGTDTWPGDADLTAIAGDDTHNATIIEFDFVPLDDELSFDFIMASEEYDMGIFECDYSDAFAFLLTDAAGNTTNLAIVPGTTDPILVTNVHPDNGSCGAINEEYFGEYTPQDLPPISFDGRTAVFTAFSEVNIGEAYHIKLVIADARDNAYDSGVFLKAGSFDIGEVDLGVDITIANGNSPCEDQTITLDTSAPNVDHVWYKDNFVIDNEIGSTLDVTEDGTYTVQIIFSPSCIISDEIVIEFLPLPAIESNPEDLVGCAIGTGTALFELSDNDDAILGSISDPENYTVTYYLTEQNAIDGFDPLVSPYQSVSDPQTVFARVENNNTGCFETTNFNLILGTEPETTFTTDFDYEVCPDATVPITIEATPVNYDLTEVTIAWYFDGVLIPGENDITLDVLDAGDYEILVTFNDTGCEGATEQNIIELETCVIPQGISPNNDGKNDTFDLSSYNVSKLEIFNRNGTSVYSKANYTNEWFGQTDDGEELPVGTYFYTMEYDNGKRRSAWVYIQRAN